MTVMDLMERIRQNVPGADLSGFLQEVTAEVRRIWRARPWAYYQTEVTVSNTHSFSNLTITNGVSAATVVDADGGGHFHQLHAGRTFTIEGESYTIDTVTDGNTVVLTGLYDFDGGSNPESGTLARVAWPLPSASGLVFSRMVKIFRERNEYYCDFRDPTDYVVTATEVEFITLLSGDADYVVRYERRPADLVHMASTLDVSEDLEEALYRGLEGRYLRRTPPRGELEMLSWQRRVSESEELYKEAIRHAQSRETQRRNMRRQNLRGLV